MIHKFTDREDTQDVVSCVKGHRKDGIAVGCVRIMLCVQIVRGKDAQYSHNLSATIYIRCIQNILG